MDKLEIACFNLESALISQQNGADRIELCDGIALGGTTPNEEMVTKARAVLTIDLYVMIRPRGGNFVYSNAEFMQMKAEIQALKKLNVDGFVFGILNEDKTINSNQNAELVTLAKPFPCTFHRAFDVAADLHQSLEAVIQCGFQAILTSGQKPNVVEGGNQLSELVKKANGRITIMPGGGLRSTNIELIQQKTKAVFYHSSAITDGSETAVASEVVALKSNLK
ncbi:MAG: copper homeostasis protein CutC [Flavobacterium sp. JAD_PAG50586_2]|nr:MAG: copper homeostasis protein CutC [Flavobacterium sp. JAD_PAG50586_2]